MWSWIKQINAIRITSRATRVNTAAAKLENLYRTTGLRLLNSAGAGQAGILCGYLNPLLCNIYFSYRFWLENWKSLCNYCKTAPNEPPLSGNHLSHPRVVYICVVQFWIHVDSIFIIFIQHQDTYFFQECAK